MLIPGYENIEELYGNDSHALHRGRRIEDRMPVLLKSPRRNPPGAADVELLEREFEILRSLSIEGVPRAFEMKRYGTICCLVLEDGGGTQLQSLLERARPGLDLFFRLATGIATILAELHRREIVHRNINPRSILINPMTGETWLIDFGMASRAAGDVTWPASFHFASDALAYISPEQTGRMNRTTDYRTDFYSLGVTLYEMLTGARPFHCEDPLEAIHRHIARTPPAPSEIAPDIPRPVSGIVIKLLAKTAEHRYQSALGLREDLEACAAEWAERRRVDDFPLGRRDVPDRFVISQKLYGREREVGRMLGAFDRACEGAASIMLVAGYSGIGKTALIQELYKPIVRQRGYFIAGKFDQVARSIPFGALIQAFRGLIQQLLTESEERLAAWRSRITESLGAGGGVIAEVIPEIELIIGKQSPPPALGPTEAQNRFQLVFQNFVGAIARREHPLAIFLDDLQWVDSATLNLFQPLLASPDIRYLFVIGAYRDNEVDAAHPLHQAIGGLESLGVPVDRISLGPLALDDLLLLTGDTLHCNREEVEPLARLVERKTGGNPFFVIEFLKALWEERLIVFDYEKGRWAFRMKAIAAADMTDNVIDLMTRKIQRLSPKAQSALTLGACIGSRFDLDTLSIVSRQPRNAAGDDLREALEEGLVLPAAYDATVEEASGPLYNFLHDRVQQAAYALIPAERKQSVHLTVGRLLLAQWDDATAEERIFDLAGHLNLGSALIDDEAERLRLARLNLGAGRKAKSSTAFEAALSYFKAGLALLSEERWESDCELMLDLHIEAAECEYLCGNFDEAEQGFELLLGRARTGLDKARVYSLRIVQYENMSRYADALAIARESLALFGVSFPESAGEKQTALETEIDSIRSLLDERDIASLIDLPVMSDPATRIIMNNLMAVWPSAYISGDQMLTRLISAVMVRLSLTHGNSEESAYGYVTHAITVGPVREDYRSAYEFGRLALMVNQRFDDSKRRAKIYQQFQAHVNLWRQPLQTCIPLAREACRSGLEAGDFTYAVYGAFTESWAALATSRDLDQFIRDYSPNLTLIRKLRAANFADGQSLLLNWARALRGETRGPLTLSNEAFDEEVYLETYRGNPFFEMFYYAARLHLYYVFEEYEKALEMADTARRIAHHLSGTIWPVLLDFWSGLTLAALYGEADENAQRTYLDEMKRARRSLESLAENCPENFLCQSLLLSAEIERISGREYSAISFYERAARYAEETGMIQHRALANELCARAWLGLGQAKVAAVFMAEARSGYAEWGASAKVEHIDRTYAELFGRRDDEGSKPTEDAARVIPSGVAAESLDVATAMKAAQAIASEIDLDKLLGSLIRIAIENAGAERGSLVLERDGEAYVRAEGDMDRAEVKAREAVPLDRAGNLSKAIVNYVRRTSESLVLADARSDDRYAADDYIARQQPRSILCTPVLNQGRLIGVLYLENNLITGAFTEDRIKLMQLISSEAAISLENARLYDEMKQEVTRRRRAEEQLRAALEEVEKLKNRLQAENVYLQEEIRKEHNFEEIVGNSPALLEVLAKVERVAPTDSTVLIQGETGTGKELIARAIHNRSRRKHRPLVKVNCGAISAGLVESELFGHVKGAFTGALERRTGRFELADGATLFLDEVSELPLDTQVKLLRVLQEGEFEAVGSSRTLSVDVRIIAATNRDLEEAVRQGRFRSDLFYRLNVFPIESPPLRERQGDVSQLVMFFLSKFSKKFGKRIDGVSQETMDLLMSYSWPGNIRELENIIERGVILSQSSILTLGRDLLPRHATAERLAAPAGAATTVSQPFNPAAASSPPPTLVDVERRHILGVLEQTRGVIEGPNGAARILNIHPNTLRSRMKKLGIQRTAHEIS